MIRACLRLFVIALGLGLVAIAAGCGGDDGADASAAEAPTAAPSPSATPTEAPTATPAPTPTPTPTPWAIDPDTVAKMPAGWDPVMAAVAPAGPTGEPPSGGVTGPVDNTGSRWKYRAVLGRLKPKEQVVEGLAGAVDTMAGRAPLTGLAPAVPEDRPAVVVKIDNVVEARPQVGLNEADIVYEELVEGGFTRLAAVYHSQHPDAVGPVRSARSTDIGIMDSFRRPVFLNSGSNSIFDRLIAKQPIHNRGAEVAEGYWRESGRPAPHNLFTSVAAMAATAEEPRAPKAHFAYRADDGALPADAVEASAVRLLYFAGRGTNVEFRWNAEVGGWQRWQGGTPHTDANGVQLAPQNLIVQYVDYLDTGMTDKFGEDLYEGVSVGTGPALVFTDGHMIEATWTRPSLRSVATFTDATGNHVALTTGQTFVSLVAPGGVSWE